MVVGVKEPQASVILNDDGEGIRNGLGKMVVRGKAHRGANTSLRAWTDVDAGFSRLCEGFAGISAGGLLSCSNYVIRQTSSFDEFGTQISKMARGWKSEVPVVSAHHRGVAWKGKTSERRYGMRI